MQKLSEATRVRLTQEQERWLATIPNGDRRGGGKSAVIRKALDMYRQQVESEGEKVQVEHK